jgi:protein TonB
MPHALLHVLNIGTLATWLSVAGFGTVAVVVPEWHPAPAVSMAEETRLLVEDFTLGDAGPAASSGETSEAAPPETVEALPAPPELAPLAEFAPLPDVPELPAPAARPTEPQSRSSARQITVGRSSSATTARTGGTPGASGSPIPDSSRLAAGHMPSPTYPAECRRKGQAGTVVVEFTVDSSGRVISAYTKSSSPWSLLNEEAVRTVRRWKFPPGGIMKLQRPIVFQLR